MYSHIVVDVNKGIKVKRLISTTYAEILIGRAFIISNATAEKFGNNIVIKLNNVTHEFIYHDFDFQTEKQLEKQEKENELY